MELVSLQTFAGSVGQSYALEMGASAITLTLVEASPLPVLPGAQRHPFSLIFRGHSPIVLPQKLYALSNETVGKMAIFLVPVGRDPAGVLYQAVFN